jgi:putative heme transporter
MSEHGDVSANGAHRQPPALDVGELVAEVEGSGSTSDGRSFERKVLMRVALLCITAISLYLLAPSLLQVFSSWTQLRSLNPYWIVPAVLFEAASFVSLWALQRVALRTRSWFAVATSQLSANAAGSIIPGGGAAAAAVQFGILVQAGVPAANVASGLAATLAATTGALFAIPVVGAVAAIGGTAAPRGLRDVAYLGAGAFVLLAIAALVAFAWDEPLRFVGRSVRTAAGWVRKGDRFAALPERLIRQRDQIRAAFTERPLVAFFATIGKWAFDYFALICILAALGLRPEPALVLLAYGAAQLLSMIPATPGGLGFVEAGLVGLLALAGVNAGDAAVATLGYRLVSYWLPLPAGLVAYVLAKRHRWTVPQTT